MKICFLKIYSHEKVGSIDEPERNFHDEAIRLECNISGYAPVQADGVLLGHPLYFRARWNGWSFVLCTNADIDPSALREGDEPGFFRDGDFQGFALWGDYGADSEASYMPYTVAEQIIRECAEQFILAGSHT